MKRCLAAIPLLAGLAAIASGSAPAQSSYAAPDHFSARGSGIQAVNIIDGADERDSLLAIGPSLGLSPVEIARIRKVSGFVGCFLPSPSVGAAALFLSDQQILTAAHILIDSSGQRRSKCFFRTQGVVPILVDLATGPDGAAFGAERPKPGSNDDYVIARLVAPIPDAEPFPVAPEAPVRTGDALIVISAHPAGLAREVDKGVPVAQGCTVRRAPVSSGGTSFFRTDCDATGSSSGGMHLARVDGELVFRGITITTGPWQDDRYKGANYDEAGGSVTTALGTDAAVLEAGRRLARR